MNIIGYYQAEEVWIPDPFLQEKEKSEMNNTYTESKYINDGSTNKMDDSIIEEQNKSFNSMITPQKYNRKDTSIFSLKMRKDRAISNNVNVVDI